MHRPLPPFARRFLAELPSAGLCVAMGPKAWDFAKLKPFPVLVLPPEKEPHDFMWPGHIGGAVVFERGDYSDDRLAAMAAELLSAGSPHVVAIREALMTDDPRHYFFPEAIRECA